MKLFTRKFWTYAFERAVKTAAQTALSLMSVDYTGLHDLPYDTVGSAAGLAAVLSVLTSLTQFKESVEAPAEASPEGGEELDADATQSIPRV